MEALIEFPCFGDLGRARPKIWKVHECRDALLPADELHRLMPLIPRCVCRGDQKLTHAYKLARRNIQLFVFKPRYRKITSVLCASVITLVCRDARCADVMCALAFSLLPKNGILGRRESSWGQTSLIKIVSAVAPSSQHRNLRID